MSINAVRTIARREVTDTLSDWRILAPMFILAFLLPLILVSAANFAIRFIDDPNTVPVLVPFVMLLADRGLREAVRDSDGLRAGLQVHAGRVTHRGLAEDTGRDYTDAPEALA